MAEEKESRIFTQKKKDNITKEHEKLLHQHSSQVDDARNSLARACWDRAGFHYTQRNIEKAMLDLSSIISLSLDETSYWDQSNYVVKAYLLRGICRLSQGAYVKAIEDFTDSIGLSPSSQAYHFRHLANAALHRHADSQEDFIKIAESKAIPINDIDKCDLVTAKIYSERARFEHSSEEFHKAALLYSEAIRLQPNALSHYQGRALAYERLGRREQAVIDRQTEAKLSESKKSSLPLYPSGAQQNERLPANLLAHVGTFEDSESLHADFQTNKTHRNALNLLITNRRLDLPEVEKQWNELSKVKEIKALMSAYQKDLAVEDLPLIMKNDMYRVHILRYAIEKNDFALIRYLQDCGVDVNKPWLERYPVSVTHSRGPRDMREAYEATEYREAKRTAIDWVKNQEPFPAKKILHLINSGFNIDDVISRAYYLLQQGLGLPSINKSDLVAAAKLIILRFNQAFEAVSDSQLSILMSSGQYFDRSFFKKMEMVFLIRQLTSIIPGRLNFLADKRDVLLIEGCIKRLNELLLAKEMTPSTVQELEKIKLDLIVHSTPKLDEKSSDLRKLLEKLRKEYPYIFQKSTEAADDKKLKPLSPITDSALSTHISSPNNSISSSCSSSSSSMNSFSFSSSIDRTLWGSGKHKGDEKNNQLTTSGTSAPHAAENTPESIPLSLLNGTGQNDTN